MQHNYITYLYSIICNVLSELVHQLVNLMSHFSVVVMLLNYFQLKPVRSLDTFHPLSARGACSRIGFPSRSVSTSTSSPSHATLFSTSSLPFTNVANLHSQSTSLRFPLKPNPLSCDPFGFTSELATTPINSLPSLPSLSPLSPVLFRNGGHASMKSARNASNLLLPSSAIHSPAHAHTEKVIAIFENAFPIVDVGLHANFLSLFYSLGYGFLVRECNIINDCGDVDVDVDVTLNFLSE